MSNFHIESTPHKQYPLRNCRTSVSMIERFYGKPLEGEMNVGKIQSSRFKTS